jgi:hypothetical protein
MKTGIIKALVAGVLLSGCTVPAKFLVTPLNRLPQDYIANAMYVLPRTSFLVTVNFEKETQIAGPYWRYSGRLLGTEAPITENVVRYRITSTDVKSFLEPDPAHYYSVNTIKGSLNPETLTLLGSAGFILNPAVAIGYPELVMNDKSTAYNPWFSDLSISLNLKEVTDTLYKTMLTDSSYVRIPVFRKQEMAKTIDQKAEETANFIIKIRKRRFKLLAGEYEIFPEGKALEVSVRELDQLEREYLELFMGKTIRENFTRSFVVRPESSSAKEQIVVTKFSDKLGFVKQDSQEGYGVVLSINPQNSPAEFEPTLFTNEEENYNYLIYRIPGSAEINVAWGSEELYRGRFSYYQSGLWVSLKQSGR